jgi:hypothetical protein
MTCVWPAWMRRRLARRLSHVDLEDYANFGLETGSSLSEGVRCASFARRSGRSRRVSRRRHCSGCGCPWRCNPGAVRRPWNLQGSRGEEVPFQLPALRAPWSARDRGHLPRPQGNAERPGPCPCREDRPARAAEGIPGGLYARVPFRVEQREGQGEREGAGKRAAVAHDDRPWSSTGGCPMTSEPTDGKRRAP